MNLSSIDVKDIIRERSAKFLDSIFSPKKLCFIGEFSRFKSGKIDRKALEKSVKQLMSI